MVTCIVSCILFIFLFEFFDHSCMVKFSIFNKKNIQLYVKFFDLNSIIFVSRYYQSNPTENSILSLEAGHSSFTYSRNAAISLSATWVSLQLSCSSLVILLLFGIYWNLDNFFLFFYYML